MCGHMVLYYPHARGMDVTIWSICMRGARRVDEDTSTEDVMRQLKHHSGHAMDHQTGHTCTGESGSVSCSSRSLNEQLHARGGWCTALALLCLGYSSIGTLAC